MKLFKIIGIALLAMCLQTSYAATNTPESVAKIVADSSISGNLGAGLPDPNREPVKSNFSDRLKRLITLAQAEQDRQMKKYPDQKPSFAELPMITGVPDGTDRYRIAKVQKSGQSARVTLEWRYTCDPRVKCEAAFTKTAMLLAPQRGRWVIVDILLDDAEESLVNALQDFH